jgi:hypothetical protein
VRNLRFPAGVFLAALSWPGLAHAEGGTATKDACLAAADQGQNQRDDGLYLSARESFATCARDVCPNVIAQSCTRWLREVEENTPTVVLGAKDERGNDLTDVTVSFDFEPLATTLDGKPVPIDAGQHVLRFERQGSVPVEQKLVLRAGEKARVVTVTLLPIKRKAGTRSKAAGVETDRETPVSAGRLGGEGAATRMSAADVSLDREALLSPHHVTAGVLVVGALAAAGAGAVFLAASNHDESSAQSLRANLAPYTCTMASTPTCQSLDDKATSQHHEMNLAVGMFSGAGVLAASGVAAWFFWPRSNPVRPQTAGSLAPVTGGLILRVTGGF